LDADRSSAGVSSRAYSRRVSSGLNVFRSELRTEWFPAPAVKTLAETGAPAWAVEAFERLRAANGGSLGSFFDVFAWREPGQVRFYGRRSAQTGSSPSSSGSSSWRCASTSQSSSWSSRSPGRRAQCARSHARVHVARIKAEFGGMRLSAMRPSHVKTWTAGLRMEGKQSNDGTPGPLAVSYVYACHARLAQIMSDAVAMLAPHLSRSGEAAPLRRHDRATLGPIRRDAGKARCCRSAPRTCRAAAGRVMRVACLRCRFHARHRLPADAVPGRGTEDRDL